MLLFYAFAGVRHAAPLQIINYLFPVTTVLFSAALVPGERLTPGRLGSVLLAFSGAFLALSGGGGLRWEDWRAPLAAFGVACAYGLFGALGRRLRYEAISGLLVFFGAGLLTVVPFVLLGAAMGVLRPPHGMEWVGMAYIGVASNCLGTLCWLSALRAGEVALVGSLVYLAVFVALVLGEPMGLEMVGGAVLVVAGALLASRVGRFGPR